MRGVGAELEGGLIGGLSEVGQEVADLLQKAGYFAGAYRKVDQGPSFDRRWNYIGTSSESFDEFFSHAPAGPT